MDFLKGERIEPLIGFDEDEPVYVDIDAWMAQESHSKQFEDDCDAYEKIRQTDPGQVEDEYLFEADLEEMAEECGLSRCDYVA